MNNEEKTKDFIVECNVCRTQYKNHVGSTPCCGSIAFDVESGSIHLYSKADASKTAAQGEG